MRITWFPSLLREDRISFWKTEMLKVKKDLKIGFFSDMLGDVSTYIILNLKTINYIMKEERGKRDGCFNTIPEAWYYSGCKD